TVAGSPERSEIPDPARCLLAIQDARTALSRSPDDWIAFRRLNEAYRYLMLQESALLAGIAIKPENLRQLATINPNTQILNNRHRQRVTALNYAIATTPPPRSDPARQELINMNLELYQLYASVNAVDLARDRLQLGLEMSKPDDLLPEMRTQLQ